MEKLSKNKNLYFNFVVAMTLKGGIGLNGDLPWKLPKDLKHLKEVTLCNKSNVYKEYFDNSKFISTRIKQSYSLIPTKVEKESINIIIIGRKSYDSIPKKYQPFKNRINIVLSRDKNLTDTSKNLFYVKDIESCLKLCKELCDESNKYNYNVNEIFVLGGSFIYDEFCKNENTKDLVKAIYLTQVHTDVNCDTFWQLPNNFETVNISKTEVENDIVYDFRVLANKNLLGKMDFNEVVISDCINRHSIHEEYQYLDIIRDIIKTGKEKKDRTGVGTISKFGAMMKYDCRSTFPLLTTKDTYWKGIVEELLWFIKGCTNVKPLQDKKVKIWDGNSTRQYLDSIGLKDREEGDLGPIYGFQWRHSGADYKTMHEDYTGLGVDQLSEVIETIKKNPDSRRIIICAWNPKDLKAMALPPCHVLCQFYVNDGEVSLQMYQRSCDMGLGVPFNIASYALLLRMVCHVTGTRPGDFIHVLGDAHVYSNHVEPLKVQLERDPLPFPLLKINPEIKNIDDFTYNDFTLIGYKHQGKIKMEMAV